MDTVEIKLISNHQIGPRLYGSLWLKNRSEVDFAIKLLTAMRDALPEKEDRP